MKKQPTVTIGIPTYLPQKILLETLDSIKKQSAFNRISKIIIAVDGVSKSNSFLKKLENKKISVIFFNRRQGQSRRINDIFNAASTDILVLTNDDVIWHKNALQHILQKFNTKKAEIVSAAVSPLPSRSIFEDIVAIGHQINKYLSAEHRDGNNYLTCNGRLLALSKSVYKHMTIPNSLWNNDAYIYLFGAINAYKYAFASRALAYYRSPSNIIEHFKQSKKFSFSYVENQTAFSKDISNYYAISIEQLWRAVFKVFKQKPLLTTLYVLMTVGIRAYPVKYATYKKTPYWETDLSTKKAYSL